MKEIKIELTVLVPEEVLEMAEQLGVPEESAIEQYTLQVEGLAYREIDFSMDEIIEYTIEAMNEEAEE